jgi:chorismate mutase/prephenate dehydratase
MDINELREQIDSIDSQLTTLFEERMKTAAAIAEYKKEHGLPVSDKARERRVLDKITAATDSEFAPYAEALYQKIFELSRSYQKKLMSPESEDK